MKDNTLLLILCIILIVIVLYYIFKNCKNNNGYSDKLDTYKNNSRLVKLNRINEQISRDLFQNTNENFNITDFFYNNRITIVITNNNNNNNNNNAKYIESNFNNEILVSDSNIFDNDTTTKTLFVNKMRTFDTEDLPANNYNFKNKGPAITGNPASGIYYYDWRFCGPQMITLLIGISEHYTQYEDDYKQFYKLDTSGADGASDKLTYLKLKGNVSYNNEIIENSSNDTSVSNFYLSTYSAIPFYHKEDPLNKKTTSSIRDKVDEVDGIERGSCADYNGRYSKCIIGVRPDKSKIINHKCYLFKALNLLMGLGLNINDDIVNDVSPYKFIDFTFNMNEINKMFKINKKNFKLKYDNNEIKLRLKDDDNHIIIIYYDVMNGGITNYLKLKKNYKDNKEENDKDTEGVSFDYNSKDKIIIGIIIPLGKQAFVTYKSIDREEIEEDTINDEYQTFDNATEQTITLYESTLYVDRHIEGTYTDTINPRIDHTPYKISKRKTSAKGGTDQHYSNNRAMMTGLFMKSNYRYIDKMHARKKHIKITNIEIQDNINPSNLNFDNTNTNLTISSMTNNINVNFLSYNPSSPLDKIYIISDTDPEDTNNTAIYYFKPVFTGGNITTTTKKEDISKENEQFNNYYITLTPEKTGNNVLYYKITQDNSSTVDIRLYIIETEPGAETYFMILYYNGFKYLQRTTTENITLTPNYDHNMRDTYVFKFKRFEEENENFQNTITEQFKVPSYELNTYKNKPIIIDITKSRGVDPYIRSALYNYISGIYSPERYLMLTDNSSIQTNDGNFILFKEGKSNNYTVDDENKAYKIYIENVDEELKATNYDEGVKQITKKNIDLIFKKFSDTSSYSDLNSLTYGNYLILKNAKGQILQCVYDINNVSNSKNAYIFQWSDHDNSEFHSLYKNGVLQESYSPFFTIEEIPGATGPTKKRMVFVISDYTQFLPENDSKILLSFSDIGNKNINDDSKQTYYENFDYFEMKNIFNTSQRFKSSPDIHIEINDISMKFTEKNNNGKKSFNFDYNIVLSSNADPNNIPINDGDKYYFHYEEDIRDSPIFNTTKINMEQINPINNYIIRYTTNMEGLVGCLDTYSSDSDYKCSFPNSKGSLDTNIENIKKIKKDNEVTTNILTSGINVYKEQITKTIKQTIIPKQKILYELIYEIYNKNTEIEKMNYKIQNKIQFLFNITRDVEYLKYLKEEKDKVLKNIKELELEMKLKKHNNYRNLLKVNEYILKINKNINAINLYLEKTGSIKENFNEQENKASSQKIMGVSYTNLNTKITNYNKKIEGHYENIKKLANIVKQKVYMKNKISYENKLNDEINDYYSTLNNIFKNKQISNNDYIYSDEFRKLPETNYMKNLGDLVLYLDKKKLELQEEMKKTDEKYLKTKRQLEKNNFQEVNYKVNHPQVTSLEMDLVLIYNNIEQLKQNIDNEHLVKEAKYKLKQIKNLKLKIKDEGVNNYNVLEPFVSSSRNNLTKRFHTIQSHQDGYLSVLPNDYSNEYKININGRCLSSYGSNDYDLQKCENKQSQYFEPRLINSKVISESVNKDRVNNNSSVKYPYYQMMSSLSNDCLTKDRDDVSIIPCSSNNKNQRWNLIENEVECLDN